MSKLEEIISHAEQQCKESGVRLTQKRKQVLAGLLESNKALSAYELIDYCKQKSNAVIPAMSVYRILNFLQQQHLVHKLNTANKYIACAYITCKDTHEAPQFLICGQCQRVEEFSIQKPILNKLKHDIEEVGFHLMTPQLEVNCLCENCFSGVA